MHFAFARYYSYYQTQYTILYLLIFVISCIHVKTMCLWVILKSNDELESHTTQTLYEEDVDCKAAFSIEGKSN